VSGNTPNRWNREHTYPDSKITGAAESDNHHIFADDWKTNNIRDNDRFADLDPSSATWVVDSAGRTTQNLTNGTYFEPLDAAKGEVARATLYLNTLYGYSLEGNFQTAELAVLWALYYPVNDWAMIRNNRVYDKQKNRNPYIDNQAYTCKVYGNTTSRTAQLCANYL
jgi:endonuclease I